MSTTPHPVSHAPAAIKEPAPPDMLSDAQLARIDHVASGATKGTWHLQDSNSCRRIGTNEQDGCVLHATRNPHDGVIDLGGPYSNLQYIVAVQPEVVQALVAELRYHRAVAALREAEWNRNLDAANSNAVGRDLDGVPQPFSGAIVLLETIAEFGALPFIGGNPTAMRNDCLRLATELRGAVPMDVTANAAPADSAPSVAAYSARPTNLTCPRCGATGLHACPGTPLEAMSAEKLAELDRALDSAEAAEEADRQLIKGAADDAPVGYGGHIRCGQTRALEILVKTAAWMKKEIPADEPGAHVAGYSLQSAVDQIEECQLAMGGAAARCELAQNLELVLRWIGQLPVSTTGATSKLMVVRFLLDWVHGGMQEPGDQFRPHAEWPASEVFGAIAAKGNQAQLQKPGPAE
jgi:hypothetical protein